MPITLVFSVFFIMFRDLHSRTALFLHLVYQIHLKFRSTAEHLLIEQSFSIVFDLEFDIKIDWKLKAASLFNWRTRHCNLSSLKRLYICIRQKDRQTVFKIYVTDSISFSYLWLKKHILISTYYKYLLLLVVKWL